MSEKTQPQTKPYRHELKYALDHIDYIAVQSRVKHIMSHDSHADPKGAYHIRSLYFDTPTDKALYEKINGVNKREKFRIRLYNHNTAFIRLEKKMKDNGLCLKVSCRIQKEECQRILDQDIEFMKDHSEPLIQELYFNMKNTQLAPKTIVDYVRQAYTYRPGNVRVTFDRFIQSGIHVTDLFEKNLPCAQAIPNTLTVMEVKYDAFLPTIIQDLVQTNRSRASAISKYAACRIYG